jgi:hypothetical protein
LADATIYHGSKKSTLTYALARPMLADSRGLTTNNDPPQVTTYLVAHCVRSILDLPFIYTIFPEELGMRPLSVASDPSFEHTWGLA